MVRVVKKRIKHFFTYTVVFSVVAFLSSLLLGNSAGMGAREVHADDVSCSSSPGGSCSSPSDGRSELCGCRTCSTDTGSGYCNASQGQSMPDSVDSPPIDSSPPAGPSDTFGDTPY
jgi:hypothetical protein